MQNNEISRFKQYINKLELENKNKNIQIQELQKKLQILIHQNNMTRFRNQSKSKLEASIAHSESTSKLTDKQGIYPSTQLEETRVNVLYFKNAKKKQHESLKMDENKMEINKRIDQNNKLKGEILSNKFIWDLQKENLMSEIKKLKNQKVLKQQQQKNIEQLKSQIEKVKNNHQKEKVKLQAQIQQYKRKLSQINKNVNQKTDRYNRQIEKIKFEQTNKFYQWNYQKLVLTNQLNIIKNQKANLQIEANLTLKNSRQNKNNHQNLQKQIQKLKAIQQNYKSDVIKLSNQIQRLIKVGDSRRINEDQSTNYKNKINQLTITNSRLLNEYNILLQSHNTIKLQLNNAININKQLQKRIHILENSNRNITVQLQKVIAQKKEKIQSPSKNTQIVKQLLEYKKINQDLTILNNSLVKQLKQYALNKQIINQIHKQQQKQSVIQNTKNHPNNTRAQLQFYNPIFKDQSDKINKKIKDLKIQNEELKKNISFNK